MRPSCIMALFTAACSGQPHGAPDAESDASSPVMCDVRNLPPLWQQTYCKSAINLAIRYSSDVRVKQADVDKYYQLCAIVYLAEPLTRLATAATATDINRIPLYSSYPPIVDHWINGVVATQDDLVDSLFAENLATGVTYPWDPFTEVPPSFEVTFDDPVSIFAMEHELTQVPDTNLADVTSLPYNDITVDWNLGQPHLHLVAGWGDCQPGCAFFHEWDASVNRGGAVEVLDRGGDAIPDWLADLARSSPDP